MRGRPPRQNSIELCDRLEKVRRSLGISRSSLAAKLGLSPSTLSRSFSRRALSKDVAARVNEFLEGTVGDMSDSGQGDSYQDAAALKRALHILQELGKIAPDLERALFRAVRVGDAGGAR